MTGLHEHLPVCALQDIVVVQLEPREPVAVHADDAEDLACHRAVRIHALRVIEKVYTLNAGVGELLLELLCLVLVHLSAYVHKRCIFLELVDIIARAAAEDLCDHVSGAAGVVDFLRVRVDRLAVDACGKHVAVAIVDGAALGMQRNGVRALCLSF